MTLSVSGFGLLANHVAAGVACELTIGDKYCLKYFSQTLRNGRNNLKDHNKQIILLVKCIRIAYSIVSLIKKISIIM